MTSTSNSCSRCSDTPLEQGRDLLGRGARRDPRRVGFVDGGCQGDRSGDPARIDPLVEQPMQLGKVVAFLPESDT